MDKKTLMFLVGALALALVLAFWFLALRSTGGEPDVWDALRAKCRDSCCLSSVDRMEQGGYQLSEDGDCPPGYRPNMLRCPTSKQWCEPSPA